MRIKKKDLIKDLFMHIGFDRAALYPYVSFFLVSHPDRDHLTPDVEQWIPIVYIGAKNLGRVRGSLSVIPWEGRKKWGEREIFAKPLTLDEVGAEKLHCVWLEVTYKFREEKTVGILIGDLDVPDIRYICDTAKNREVDFVVLPSYGGVSTHGAEYPTQLRKKVEEAARELKNDGIIVVARPHPVEAEWADINLKIVAPPV